VEAVLEAQGVVAAAAVFPSGPPPYERLALQRDLQPGGEAGAQHRLHRSLPLGGAPAHPRSLVLESGLDLERAHRHDLRARGDVRAVGIDLLGLGARDAQAEQRGGDERAERKGPNEVANSRREHDTEELTRVVKGPSADSFRYMPGFSPDQSIRDGLMARRGIMATYQVPPQAFCRLRASCPLRRRRSGLASIVFSLT
jgi:hypothetical protein